MFEDAVLAAAWSTTLFEVGHRNDENAAIDAEELRQWKSDLVLATAAGKPPRARLPKHKTIVAVSDAAGLPVWKWGAADVYTDPADGPDTRPSAVGKVDEVVGGLIEGKPGHRYNLSNKGYGVVYPSADGRLWYLDAEGFGGISQFWREITSPKAA